MKMGLFLLLLSMRVPFAQEMPAGLLLIVSGFIPIIDVPSSGVMTR